MARPSARGRIFYRRWFARKITPPESTSNAGHRHFQAQKQHQASSRHPSYVSAQFLNRNLPDGHEGAGNNSLTENSLISLSLRLSATKTRAPARTPPAVAGRAARHRPAARPRTTATATKFSFRRQRREQGHALAQHVRP